MFEVYCELCRHIDNVGMFGGWSNEAKCPECQAPATEYALLFPLGCAPRDWIRNSVEECSEDIPF